MSKRTVVAGVVLAGTALVMVAGGRRAEAQSSPDNRFYGCENGWTFQSVNDAARCRRGGDVSTVALLACPQTRLPTGQRVGTARSQDYQGNRDMCVTQIPGAAIIALEIPCPVGYSKSVRPGLDNCTKENPVEVKSPSLIVQRTFPQ